MTRGLSLVGGGLRFVRGRPPCESWLLARAAGWVAVVSLLVKFLPLPRVLALVSPRRSGPPRSTARVADERLVQLIDAMLACDVLCFTPTCWKRAPVLHRYLALAGRQTRIVFGLRKEGGDVLAGHAWLEADGVPIYEAAPPDYTVTYEFPSPDTHPHPIKQSI